jgi:geranylgeranyl diphosphate synthase type I
VSPDLRAYLAAIEEGLQHAVSNTSVAVAPLYGMMAYHLGWADAEFRPVESYSGKRLRPLLCLLSCEAAGGDWRAALPAAAAIELVHNFSLIHDDIEDSSAKRRGRPTLWSLWGPAHGINAGDAMLMLARLAMSELSAEAVGTATVLQAMRILDSTCLQLCQGQYLDMAYEGRLDVSSEAYLEMIALKTAALMAASTWLGALIGGATGTLDEYREFGRNLGLAFQMEDDLLGIWGDPATTGKPAADDIRSRKMTLPVIHALASGDEGCRLARVYGGKSLTEKEVGVAMAILEGAGAREYVQHRVAQYESAALRHLVAAAPLQPAARHLHSLVASLAGRQT